MMWYLLTKLSATKQMTTFPKHRIIPELVCFQFYSFSQLETDSKPQKSEAFLISVLLTDHLPPRNQFSISSFIFLLLQPCAAWPLSLLHISFLTKLCSIFHTYIAKENIISVTVSHKSHTVAVGTFPQNNHLHWKQVCQEQNAKSCINYWAFFARNSISYSLVWSSKVVLCHRLLICALSGQLTDVSLHQSCLGWWHWGPDFTDSNEWGGTGQKL